MNIQGVDKPELFRALYNAAKVINKANLHMNPADEKMDSDQAKHIIANCPNNFTEVNGRELYINLTRGKEEGKEYEVDTTGYNSHNGEGAAEKILAEVKKASKKANKDENE